MRTSLAKAKIIFTKINSGERLRDANPEFIFDVFSALSRRDAYLIEKQISLVTNQKLFEEAKSNNDYYEDHVFKKTFVSVLLQKNPGINANTDSGHDAWIASAARELTSQNIQIMEGYIVRDRPATAIEKLHFYQKINLEQYDSEAIKVLNHSLIFMRAHINNFLGPTFDVDAIEALMHS